MKIKYLILSSFLAFSMSFSSYAQNNPGVNYLALGEKELAKNYFMKTIRQAPAESYYYLGEIAYSEGNYEEAKANYEKNLAANPESALSAIGLAKLELKNNPKEAESQLSAIQKKNKKNVNVILAIAQAYLDNGMQEKALDKLADARKVDKKSPYVYIFEGDMLLKENKPGEAATQYDQAAGFDPTCALAYIKSAKVYESINPQTAAETMKKATEVDPDNIIAYKYLADIYVLNGEYPKAIDAYKIFFEDGSYTVDDIRRYASAAYFNKQYDLALPLIKEGLAKDPDNFALNRFLMYCYNDLKNYEEATPAAEKFFSLTPPKDIEFIVQDYMAYGNILSEAGNKKEAINAFKKASELDAERIGLLKEIATICSNEDMNEDAAVFYKKYINALGEEAAATDYFQLGRYYYMASDEVKTAASDTLALSDSANVINEDVTNAKVNQLLLEADSAFATVTERVPDSYLGYQWRARANSSLDPETDKGLAKPYYELMISNILNKDTHDNNSELLEGYQYLAYYNYLNYEKSKKAEDKAQVKAYAEKILEIDPENQNGKIFYEFAK